MESFNLEKRLYCVQSCVFLTKKMDTNYSVLLSAQPDYV